jgi:hypothetical protein
MSEDKITNWINRIDENTALFRQSFSVLSANQLNWKPTPSIWSIAENMEHLITVNESYFPLLEEVKANRYKKPFAAMIPGYANMIGKIVLKAVEPERKKKIKTFPIWEPKKSGITEHIVEQFTSHQEELKRFMHSHLPLVEQNVIISSPVNRNVVYHLPVAFEIIVTHELRHYHQAKEVMGMQMKKMGF